MRRCFFFLNRPRTVFFFCSFFAKDKFHYFSIQGDRSTDLLWTTNYRIDYIIKRCHEENSITSGLILNFSQNKPSRFSLDQRQIFSASSCRVFERTLIELRFNMIKNLLLLKASDTLGIFRVPLHAMSMFD